MTLLSVMMVLSVMALMTLGAARYALWGERLSQGERDLAVSFEAAEAALLDAEWDVMGLRTDPANGEASKRHCDFVAAEFLANTRPGAAVCGQGQSVGVCFDAAHPGQAWRQASPWLRTEVGQAAQNRTVAYGQFTGAAWGAVTQGGVVPPSQTALPVQPPRYVVEWAPLIPLAAEQARAGWVITAVGFGLNPATQTWLQVVLDKPGPAVQTPCADTTRGPQSPWQYQAPRMPTALPNRWRCQAALASTDGTGATPSPARLCGRLSWRELGVGNPGFTLVELMVVVAILGVLVALVYPNYLHYVSRAKRMRCQTQVMLEMQSQERFKSERLTYRLLPAAPAGESPACEVGARACPNGSGAVGGKNSAPTVSACIEVFAQALDPNSEWVEMSLDSQGRPACVMADARWGSACWQ